MAANAVQKPLQIGVLLLSDLVQLLDAAPIDLLTSIRPTYLQICGISEEMVARGAESDVHYISEDGVTPINMTSDAKWSVTVCTPIS